MSKRPLGPWVWCRYCRYYFPGRYKDGQTCIQPTPRFRYGVEGNLTSGLRFRVPDTAKKNGDCHPRLTFLGWVRRTLGLTIGEKR